jgi:hypothetical protein
MLVIHVFFPIGKQLQAFYSVRFSIISTRCTIQTSCIFIAYTACVPTYRLRAASESEWPMHERLGGLANRPESCAAHKFSPISRILDARIRCYSGISISPVLQSVSVVGCIGCDAQCIRRLTLLSTRCREF